jgi:hypothetical protein
MVMPRFSLAAISVPMLDPTSGLPGISTAIAVLT